MLARMLLAAMFAMPGVDAPPDRPGERLHFFRPAGLPQTEWMVATDSARMWRTYHEHYTFCVMPRDGNTPDAGALYSYRNSEVECRPYSAFFYEPDTLHANRIIFHPASFYVVRVDTATVTALAEELGLGSRPHFRLDSSSSPRILDAFLALATAVTSGEALEQQTRLVEMLRVVLEEAGERRPATATSARPALERAREYLHIHLRDGVTLDDLARVSGISRYHLVHSFRASYGVAPHAYQSALRAAEARRLLQLGVPRPRSTLGSSTSRTSPATLSGRSRSRRRPTSAPSRSRSSSAAHLRNRKNVLVRS